MSWKASGAAKEINHGTDGQKLKIADKLVLMILSDDYNEGRGFAWPSQETLAKECLCTDRGLRGILERLEDYGLIEIEHRGRQGNRYKLLFDLKNSKILRNAVPQSDYLEERGSSNLEEQAGSSKDDLEERRSNLEERAGSSELEVEPIRIEPPVPTTPTTKPSKKSKSTPNYKTFQDRYYGLTDTTPGKKPWLVARYEELCSNYGEDAILDFISKWVADQGGARKLKGNQYAPGDFLDQVETMLTINRDESEEKFHTVHDPINEVTENFYKKFPERAPFTWRLEHGYEKADTNKEST